MYFHTWHLKKTLNYLPCSHCISIGQCGFRMTALARGSDKVKISEAGLSGRDHYRKDFYAILRSWLKINKASSIDFK